MTKICAADGRTADVALVAARQCAAPGFHAVVRFDEAGEVHVVQDLQESVRLFRAACLVLIEDDDVHVVIAVRDVVGAELIERGLCIVPVGGRRFIERFRRRRLGDGFPNLRPEALDLLTEELAVLGDFLTGIELVEADEPAVPAILDVEVVEGIEEAGSADGRKIEDRDNLHVFLADLRFPAAEDAGIRDVRRDKARRIVAEIEASVRHEGMEITQRLFPVKGINFLSESIGKDTAELDEAVPELILEVEEELPVLGIALRLFLVSRCCKEFEEAILQECRRHMVENEVVIRIEMELAAVIIAPFVIELLGQGVRHLGRLVILCIMTLGVEVDDKAGRQRFQDVVNLAVVEHQLRIRRTGHVRTTELEDGEQGIIIAEDEIAQRFTG